MRRVFERLRNRTAAFVHDLIMIPLAWMAAYWLRFNLEAIPPGIWEQGLRMLPVVVLIQGAVFWYLGLYRGVWRFASLPDLLRIINSIVVGVSLAAVAIFLLTRMQDVPRSVLPIHALLLLMALGGPRLAYRWLKERRLSLNEARRVLIVGAGETGEALVRELRRDRTLALDPVGFLDDDSAKRGREIHGVRVLAKVGRLPRVVQSRGVDLVVLATPSASSVEMRRMVELCERAGVAFQTLPTVSNAGFAKRFVDQLRPVSIEDLLGRDAVELDMRSIITAIAGKTVVVTGGGGSIGSELCRQVAELTPNHLTIVDHSEFALYSIELELREQHPALDITPVLLDVADERAVERMMVRHRPDIVFHAAAYKHVPMLQSQPLSALKVNVLGTASVARAARRSGVGVFVLVSTDKAVNPTNVMGASKRAAELVCQAEALSGQTTRFMAVRFGNVLDSAGSVVPLFRRQISEGGPVTVTHPDVKRYFMTIPEACQLILKASSVGKGGEVFVLDMGEPVVIQYLAEQMILLSGKRPNIDINIVHTGLRPGEKLFEELFHDSEQPMPTEQAKLLLATVDSQSVTVVEDRLATIGDAIDRGDEALALQCLHELVPALNISPPGADNVVSLGSSHGRSL